MSSNPNNGGPAFPKTGGRGPGDEPSQGMTLRDYFAAKAMQAFISKLELGPDGHTAHISYRMSDAMIEEREARHA